MNKLEYHASIANWQKDSEDIKNIRTRVFIEEQHVPAELEWDEFDESCTHFIVRHQSHAIATARLKPDGQIGRMAVLKNHRQLGVGSLLLSTLIEHAKNTGLLTLYLHAQVQVTGFYQKYGFAIAGEKFIDAGIPHREMLKKIC